MTSKRGNWADLKKLYRAASSEPKPAQAIVSPSQKPSTSLLSEEDKALFKQQMRGVKRLKTVARLEKAPIQIAQQKAFFHAKRQQAEGVDSVRVPLNKSALLKETDCYAANPQQAKSLLKKVRSGDFPVMSTLDLHHHTSEEAWEALNHFIASAHQYRVRCVCIIHGKGIGSPDKPVLKPQIQSWLRHFDYVELYCTAPVNMGGDGALIVLLKTGV